MLAVGAILVAENQALQRQYAAYCKTIGANRPASDRFS
jgi:hypothetical protein